jgi:hypothetical protein
MTRYIDFEYSIFKIIYVRTGRLISWKPETTDSSGGVLG